MHIDFSVLEDCQNLYDSYGEICVKCNCCGRFDESTKLEAQLKMHKEQLKENIDFGGWWEECNELQEANVKANIEYHEREIKDVEEKIRVR